MGSSLLSICNIFWNVVQMCWNGLGPPGGRVLPYKGLMGTRGESGYVFRDFCLKQGIEFIIFCLYQGIDLSIFVLNRKNVLNRVSKIGILS